MLNRTYFCRPMESGCAAPAIVFAPQTRTDQLTDVDTREPKQLLRMINRWLSLLALIGSALCLPLTSGCAKPAAATPPPAKPKPAVVAAKPVVMPIVEWDEFVGRLEAIETVEVRSRVSGYLASTSFEEGQLVRAGDILAVIDQRPFLSEISRNRANLEEARAQLGQAQAAVAQAEAEGKRSNIHRELAKKQHDRNTVLIKQKATALQDFEISEAELAQSEADVIVAKSKIDSAQSTVIAAQAAINIAQSNLELAELNLQYTEIRSPINGRISSRYVTEGNLVSGGTNDATLLTTIVSLHPMHCYFDADEATFLRNVQLLRDGKLPSGRDARYPVYVALSNEREGYPHVGHMDFIDNRMDQHTGTIRGRAILPNEDLQLTPGLFARVRVPGSPRYEAILIPDKAIGTDQAEKFVMTIDKDQKVVRKSVTLGPMSHGLRIIRAGLSGDEMVVLGGLQRAKPGMEVAMTTETIALANEVLPDDIQPVPPDKWLTPKRTNAGNVTIPKQPLVPRQASGSMVPPARTAGTMP